MTPEARAQEIIRQAEAAWSSDAFLSRLFTDLETRIAAAIRQAVTEERAACAFVADMRLVPDPGRDWPQSIAAAIRARGEEKPDAPLG